MINFTWQTPTKIIFGKGVENEVGAEITARGFKKVLVHFGGGSVVKSGLLDRVKASLDATGIAHVELGGVVPNPRVSLVRKGIELCRKEGVDFILAVGGGSVIDSAKGIGYGVPNDFDVWELFTGKAQPKAFLPVGCVLTLAASGSEMSDSTVLTRDEDDDKRGYNNTICRPLFAAMNPELTFSLPEYQTMCGVVDILMHTLERYFTNDSGEVVDRMAEGLMVAVIEAGRRLFRNPRDYEARAEVMWAGSLSHNGLTGAGRTSDFASHQLELTVSGIYDVAHGAGLSAIWPSWARYVCRHNIARFAQFAVRVMGCRMNYFDPTATAAAGIDALERYFRDINMPVTLAELGVDADDAAIERMVDMCSRQGTRTIGQFVKLDQDDMRHIYGMAR
jgi:Uncharacterized oxidoreductases, Fe-dependent alcohol dehydrogenase family